MATYAELLEEYNRKLAKYNKDLEAYNQSVIAYRECIAETKEEEVVNGNLAYNLQITSRVESGGQYGDFLMQGRTSGNSFQITYTNVAGALVGTATIYGSINVSYVSLGSGRIRATINSVHFDRWVNVKGNATSWYASVNPTIILRDINGNVVWRMDNYDPETSRTVTINRNANVGRSFDLNPGQTVSPFVIAQVDDIWLASGYGNIKVGFTNNSTVTRRTVPKNTEASCRLLLLEKPVAPIPPEKPKDFRPWATRKSGKFKSHELNNGWFKIRKSSSWKDVSIMSVEDKNVANKGNHRIRKSSVWKGQSQIGGS